MVIWTKNQVVIGDMFILLNIVDGFNKLKL